MILHTHFSCSGKFQRILFFYFFKLWIHNTFSTFHTFIACAHMQTKGREYIGTDILHAHPGDINRFLYGLNNTITHNLFQIFSINLLIFYFIEQIVHLCIQFFSKCLINLMFCTSLIQKGFVFFFYELIDIRSHMRHLFSWFCTGNK